MKIEAWKSDDGILYETEKECKIQNIKLKIIEFINPKKDASLSLYRTMSDYERDRFAKEISELVISKSKEFKILIEEITSIASEGKEA